MGGILWPLQVSSMAWYSCSCMVYGRCRSKCGGTPSQPADLFFGARRHPCNSCHVGLLVSYGFSLDVSPDELPAIVGVRLGVPGKVVQHMLCAPNWRLWRVLGYETSAPPFYGFIEVAGSVHGRRTQLADLPVNMFFLDVSSGEEASAHAGAGGWLRCVGCSGPMQTLRFGGRNARDEGCEKMHAGLGDNNPTVQSM